MSSNFSYYKLAADLKKDISHQGYLTLKERDLRDKLGLKRLKRTRAEEITRVLRQEGLEVYPPLNGSQDNPVRVYSQGSRAWKLLQEILNPIGLYEEHFVSA